MSEWKEAFRPLRVVAHLASPVAAIPGEPLLPLDGILEYAAFALGWPGVDRKGQSNRTPLRPLHEQPTNFLLPLKRHGHRADPDWFWFASWASFPGGYTTDRVHWNKRFDGADPVLTERLDYQGRRGKADIGAGRYKSYHMPMCLVVAPCLQWHCLGAADGVARLLAAIHQLGHKRSQGFGEVRKWELFAARQDYSLLDAQGRPARALPASQFSDGDRRHTGLRAPYWHPSRRRECVTPAMPAPGEIQLK